MAKAIYLKLVGCTTYNNPTIIRAPISKGQVIRLTNPEWIEHLKGLKTVIGEDNEKFWFKDVTGEEVFQVHEEQFSAAETAAMVPAQEAKAEEDDEAPVKSAAKGQRTTRAAPAPKAK